jgi:hypothetical protein
MTLWCPWAVRLDLAQGRAGNLPMTQPPREATRRRDARGQSALRRRVQGDAKEMLAYQHSGFSVDAGVCIEADDRAALERLLRYCARPPFAMERLRKEGAALVYRCAKQRSEPTSDKRGAKVDELHLTALELIDRIAALVPPPRTHRHRYFGVLAPNSPLRSAVTAMADAQPDATGDDAHRPAPLGNAISPTPEPVLTPRLTGAGARSAEGTNTGHENGEAMASVGVRVEPTVS